ncbi:MAG: cell division protein FtsA [Deltaproteobacteria bacterium]
MTDLYRTQRAMRNMRQAAIQRGVISVLDIGTTKIACLILRFDGEEPKRDADGVGPMAGQTAFRIVGAATTRSRGVRFGEISSMQETERAIRTVVQAAQKMAGVRVDHAIACFSGGLPRSYGLTGEAIVQSGTVSEQDVARVMAACEIPEIGREREVLHAQPVNFTLDHRTGLNDPRGQVGQRLSVDMHLMTVDEHVIQILLQAIKRCDLELAGIASAGYTSALSALVEDEQELGAACVDMGGGTTSLSIFLKRHMIYADCVAMGGEHVTSDISKGLQVSLAQAERMKNMYGGVLATGMDDREMIEIGGETGDWERDRRRISRAELIGIMRPRVEEILEEVRARLDAAGFDHMPSQQIVLTGGGSQIPGLDTLAPRILGQQVRIGRPLRVQGLPQAATGAAFASAVGLCLFSAHPQDEWWDFEIPAESYPARSLRRAVKWFKENW